MHVGQHTKNGIIHLLDDITIANTDGNFEADINSIDKLKCHSGSLQGI